MTDFVDVAYHDGVVNWQVVRSQPGIRGGIVKCGDGYFMPVEKASNGLWNFYTNNPAKRWHYDPYFAQNWEGLKGCELRGAYWFVRLNFDKRPFDSDAGMKRQAQLFFDKVSENGLLASDVIVADLEQGVKQIAYLTQAQKIVRVREFLDECERLFGRRPIIYTYPSWWFTQMGNEAWALKYKLWIADYTPPIWIPLPWLSFWAHQFTDKGKIAGVPTAADLNKVGADYEIPAPVASNPCLDQLSIEEIQSYLAVRIGQHG